MATIRPRRRKDGSIGYTATIRIKRDGRLVYTESQTFSREAMATEWARRREVDLEKPGALQKAKAGDTSLGALIKRYREEYSALSKWQRSKEADLKKLEGQPIAAVNVLELTAQILIDHVRQRRIEGAGPATVLNDLVWIGVVLKAAKTAWSLPVNPEVVREAREFCWAKKLVGKSRKRDRLPTCEELEQLDRYFAAREGGRSDIPMRQIMWFAIYSAKREAEICRIEAEDNRPEEMTGLVRDAKHPRHKDGNHRRFNYTPEAWRIVQLRDMKAGPIFPYNPRTVGSYFTAACAMLGIEDLHFHDLRHEATTRLFERGWGIPQVAAVTLHESWNELKRYTHIRKRSKVLEAPFLSGG
ncbi:MAG TPA: tyrosine-type recombinase/integrase [Nevskia sp.]|nr:tyrosine-type recombinase/integrase [Nevskia sp.]